jgi:hypothetical protein
MKISRLRVGLALTLVMVVKSEAATTEADRCVLHQEELTRELLPKELVAVPGCSNPRETLYIATEPRREWADVCSYVLAPAHVSVEDGSAKTNGTLKDIVVEMKLMARSGRSGCPKA